MWYIAEYPYQVWMGMTVFRSFCCVPDKDFTSSFCIAVAVYHATGRPIFFQDSP